MTEIGEQKAPPDSFPYRYPATEGMYAGTTFIYLGDGTVISYRTDSPTCYFLGRPSTESWGHWPARMDMTPGDLARFEATPERGGRQ